MKYLKMNKFKIGDKVVCAETSIYNDLLEKFSYTISDVDGNYIALVEDKIDDYHYYYTRFKLSIKTVRKNKLEQLTKYGI